MIKINKQELDNRFIFHGEAHFNKKQDIRQYAKDFAYLINKLCQDEREKCIALTKLEEVVFWANTSIDRQEDH